MTFSSILFKLLPFTYIDNNQEVHWGTWSELTDGDKIITAVEVFLIFLFIWYAGKLFVSWWKDRRQIVLLSSLLSSEV